MGNSTPTYAPLPPANYTTCAQEASNTRSQLPSLAEAQALVSPTWTLTSSPWVWTRTEVGPPPDTWPPEQVETGHIYIVINMLDGRTIKEDGGMLHPSFYKQN